MIVSGGVGEKAFDQYWYETILKACCLRKELLFLPLQDFTLAGSNGINLNVDQRQKIVSNNNSLLVLVRGLLKFLLT